MSLIYYIWVIYIIYIYDYSYILVYIIQIRWIANNIQTFLEKINNNDQYYIWLMITIKC